MMDATQAFLQPDPLPEKDKCAVIVPPYIALPSITVKEAYSKADNAYEYVMKMNKPLYGSRTAPLRWWLKISQHMRQWGLRQHRLDICMYTWRDNAAGQVIPIDLIIILHVDDFLVGRSETGLRYFTKMMDSFRTGEICTLTQTNPLVYLGINISLDSRKSIILPQHDFTQRLCMVDPNRFVSRGAIVMTKPKLMTAFRSILGNLIWALQTQFSVSFLITRIATSIAHCCNTAHEVLDMISLANKIIRTLKVRPTVLHYVALFDKPISYESIMELKLFSFSDCGFGTLHLHRSVESQLVILGRPIRRDGDITLVGHALDFASRKISRTTRSTLAGEAVALANAVDSGIFLQSVLIEIFFGFVSYLHINNVDPYPLTTPFEPSPDLGSLRQKIISGDKSAFSGRTPSTQEWDKGGSARYNMTARLTNSEKRGTFPSARLPSLPGKSVF